MVDSLSVNHAVNGTPRPLRQGMVQIFTGDGKGKTTAALGTALRALGHGLKVFVAVFMKGDYPYGEWEALATFPNATVMRFGFRDFTDPNHVKPEERAQAETALAAARQALVGGAYDLVILDEVNVASAWQLISTDEVVRLIKDRPAHVELILTGRRADPRLIDLADLVTECVKVKHPYDKGTQARSGIEF
jgi:cob(I)alamin adenosyltransferase